MFKSKDYTTYKAPKKEEPLTTPLPLVPFVSKVFYGMIESFLLSVRFRVEMMISPFPIFFRIRRVH